MYLGQLDNAIVQDYKAFIRTLPKSERVQVESIVSGEYYISEYEDGKGDHAIRFDVGIDGIFVNRIWYYVLIYNKENKRVKVIRYPGEKTGFM